MNVHLSTFSSRPAPGRLLCLLGMLLGYWPASQAQDCTPPSLTITGSPALTIATGTSCKLTAAGADSYAWSTGANSSTVSVSTAGTYSVTGTTGNCSSVRSVEVVVVAPCRQDFLFPCDMPTGIGYPNYLFFHSNGTKSNIFAPGETIYSYAKDPSGPLCKSPSVIKPVYATLPPVANVICPNIFTTNYQTFSLNLSGELTSVLKTCQKVGPIQYLSGTQQKFSIATPGVYPITFSDGTTVNITISETATVPPDLNTVALAASAKPDGSVSLTATPSSQDFLRTLFSPTTSGPSYQYAHYKWLKNDQVIARTDSSTNTYTVANPGWGDAYQVQIEYAYAPNCGNQTIISNAVTIPNPTLSAGSGGVCAGGTVNLSVSVPMGTAPFSYTWIAPPSLTLSDQSSPSVTATASPTASGVVSVTALISDSSTPVQTTAVTTSLTLVAVPVLTITPASQTITAGSSATLTASGADAYVWDTGAATASLVTVTAGTYSVTGTSATGCSATASAVVRVAAVRIVASATTLGCATPTVSLSAVGTGSYRWSTGAISSSITVSMAGVYSVTLTTATGSTATASVSITKETGASVSISPSSLSLTCQSPTASLSAVGAGSVVWSTGETSRTIAVTTAGTYSVMLTSPAGCTATAKVSLTSGQTVPSISIGYSNTVLSCSRPSLTLTALGTGAVVWSTGASSTTISVSEAGPYSVTLTNSSGCMASANVSISADQAVPALSVTPSSATLGCTTPTVSLSAVGVGKYRWSNGSSAPSLVTNTAGVYSVTLTGANGCTATASVSITKETGASVSISPSSLSLTCQSPTASLSAVGAGSVVWSTGETSRTIAVTTAGTYSVTLTSPAGCTATAKVSLTSGQTVPSVSIGYSGTVLSCSRPSLTLTALGTGAVVWSTGASSTTISVSEAGVYSVTLTNSSGCTASANVNISADQAVPALSVTPSSATLGCTTPTVSLSAVGVGKYRWSNGSSAPSLVTNTAGVYSVTLTGANGCTATASAYVIKELTAPISITKQPLSATSVSVGARVSTGVSVSGPAIAYQWFKAGTSLGTAQQTSALTLPNVQLSDAGRYWVVVSSACTSLTSTAFSLSVLASPTSSFVAPVASDAPLLNTVLDQTARLAGAGSSVAPAVSGGRSLASEVAPTKLSVQVLGNPTHQNWVQVQIDGASGESLVLEVLTEQGQRVSRRQVEGDERATIETVQLGTFSGRYFLKVSTPTQQQTVKIIKW